MLHPQTRKTFPDVNKKPVGIGGVIWMYWAHHAAFYIGVCTSGYTTMDNIGQFITVSFYNEADDEVDELDIAASDFGSFHITVMS